MKFARQLLKLRFCERPTDNFAILGADRVMTGVDDKKLCDAVISTWMLLRHDPMLICSDCEYTWRNADLRTTVWSAILEPHIIGPVNPTEGVWPEVSKSARIKIAAAQARRQKREKKDRERTEHET